MDDKFFKKAFDIGELPENIDLDSPPVTGFDYLYRVRLESKKCPKVVVSNIDTAQFVHHQNVKVDFCNGFIRASPGFEPELKWQDHQLNLFSKYKAEFLTHRHILKSKFPKRQFPKVNKKDEWCIYCFGREKFEQIYGETNNAESEESCSSKRKKSRFSDKRNSPLLSVILYLNHNHIIKLMAYQIDWLEKMTFTHEHGEWLYSLLLCLEKPLDPDTCALLRSLSRVCSDVRSRLTDPEDDILKPLNAIITIISCYFDQRDMSDNFSKEDADSK